MRTCLDCGTPCLGSRCTIHERARQQARNASPQRAKYRGDWDRTAKAAITAYRALHGDTCPGWGTPPHPVTPPNTWACDHHLGPLCASCNGRKAAIHDRDGQPEPTQGEGT